MKVHCKGSFDCNGVVGIKGTMLAAHEVEKIGGHLAELVKHGCVLVEDEQNVPEVVPEIVPAKVVQPAPAVKTKKAR